MMTMTNDINTCQSANSALSNWVSNATRGVQKVIYPWEVKNVFYTLFQTHLDLYFPKIPSPVKQAILTTLPTSIKKLWKSQHPRNIVHGYIFISLTCEYCSCFISEKIHMQIGPRPECKINFKQFPPVRILCGLSSKGQWERSWVSQISCRSVAKRGGTKRVIIADFIHTHLPTQL